MVSVRSFFCRRICLWLFHFMLANPLNIALFHFWYRCSSSLKGVVQMAAVNIAKNASFCCQHSQRFFRSTECAYVLMGSPGIIVKVLVTPDDSNKSVISFMTKEQQQPALQYFERYSQWGTSTAECSEGRVTQKSGEGERCRRRNKTEREREPKKNGM